MKVTHCIQGLGCVRCVERVPWESLPSAMMGVLQEVLTLSMCKTSEIIGERKKTSYPLLLPDWRWEQGKADRSALEVRMEAGEGWTEEALV